MDADTPIYASDMNALATRARALNLIGGSASFFPPLFFASSQAAQLSLWQSEWWGESASASVGGFCYRTDQGKLYQLTQPDHTQFEHWVEVIGVPAGATLADLPGAAVGAMGVITGPPSAFQAIKRVAGWARYAGWWTELGAIRSEANAILTSSQVPRFQTIDGELHYVQPEFMLFSQGRVPLHSGADFNPLNDPLYEPVGERFPKFNARYVFAAGSGTCSVSILWYFSGANLGNYEDGDDYHAVQTAKSTGIWFKDDDAYSVTGQLFLSLQSNSPTEPALTISDPGGNIVGRSYSQQFGVHTWVFELGGTVTGKWVLRAALDNPALSTGFMNWRPGSAFPVQFSKSIAGTGNQVNGIHNTSPLWEVRVNELLGSEIPLIKVPRAIGGGVFKYAWQNVGNSSDNTNSARKCTCTVTAGPTNGWWYSKTPFLSAWDCDPYLLFRSPSYEIKHVFALQQHTSATWTTDGETRTTSRRVQYVLPKYPVFRDTDSPNWVAIPEGPGGADPASHSFRIGSIVWKVDLWRCPTRDAGNGITVIDNSSPLAVTIGCIRNGAFAAFGAAVTIPALANHISFAVDWPILSPHSLAYQSASAVNVEAMIASVYQSAYAGSGLGAGDPEICYPISAFHYNDASDLLDLLQNSHT